jgi:murein DD-endopeptidase MepM/ murein hydrolase activator NlpD
MKYIIPSLLALLLILIFYPNDYDEVDTNIYIGNSRYYNIYDRQSVYSGPDTVAANGSGTHVTDTGEWVMPVNDGEGFYISSLIGYRKLSGYPVQYHRGFDLSNGRSGSSVLSIGNGSVVDIKPDPWNSSGYGIVVTIRYHSDTIGNFCVIYAHMESYDTSLSVGSAVQKGQAIGKVGNTGQSYGAHLHWQCFYGVKYTDLNNSFNPFQVLYPVENKAKDIREKYGLQFYAPGGYAAENAFYAYAANRTQYAEHYKENQRLGMLLEDFFN